MSTEQAGTPPVATPENRGDAGQAAAGDDSGLNAQQKKEFMTLKQKAEDFNKLAEQNRTLEAQLEEARRSAFNSGRQATDPRAELIAKLQANRDFDPASEAALVSMQEAALARAETWLMGQMSNVPANKRAQVEGLVRQSGFQMSVNEALTLVTDPDTKTLSEQLAESQKELERLRGAKANGTSPAAALPSTANADEDSSGVTEIKRSDYFAALQKGGPRALELMKAVGENRTKLVFD